MLRTGDTPKREPSSGIGAVRLLRGTFLISAPAQAIRLLGGQRSRRALVMVRVLGGRHLLEALAELRDARRWRRIAVLADSLHAMTALGLAGADPAWRRPALTDAAIATGFAAWGWRTGRPGTG